MNFTLAAIVAILYSAVLRYVISKHKEAKIRWEATVEQERKLTVAINKYHRGEVARITSEKAAAIELLIEEVLANTATDLYKTVAKKAPVLKERRAAAVEVVPKYVTALAASRRLRAPIGEATRP